MTWWDAVPVLLASLLVVFVPGGAALVGFGVRGLPLFALAPAVSAAVLGGTAILFGFLGLPWQPWVALLATVLAVVVAVLLRRWTGAPEALRGPLASGGGRFFAVGAAVAAVIGTVPIAAGMRQVDRVPQTWDAIFHLNAMRYVEDTGQASSFLLNGMVHHGATSGFYPAGWHVSAGTVLELLGADPAVVANTLALLLAGLVVPAGTALATRALMPEWRWAAGVGAVAGALFAALPALMMSWGTLWPNAWATGMLPALLGAALLCMRRSDLASWFVVAVAAGGAAVIHPSFLFAFAFLGAPLALQALGRRWRGLTPQRRRRLQGEAAVLVLLAVAVVLALTQSSILDYVRAFRWPQAGTAPQAVGEALLDAPLSMLGHGVRTGSFLLGGLLFLGVIRAAGNRDQRAWVVSLLVAVGAFAISAGAPVDHVLRNYVTSFWYNDPVRLAGLVPVVAAPLVAVGFRVVAEWVEDRLPGRLLRAPRGNAIVAAALVPAVVLAFLVATGGYAQKRANLLDFWYWPLATDEGRQVVTPAEQDLLRRLGDITPPGARVLADPFTGGALAYALGDREVLFPHLAGGWSDTALRALRLMPDLRDPRTCSALEELGVDHLYVDSEQYVEGDLAQERFENLDEAPASGVRLIERADTAALYEITACR